MYTIGAFPIITTDRYFLLKGMDGLIIRSFTVSKYEMDHVRAYREGYVKALNTK